MAIAAEGLGINKLVVVHGDEAITKRCLVSKGKGANEGLWENVGGVGLEASVDQGQRGVGGVASCPGGGSR